ncbi:glycosyltransferase [Citrobacter braakii]|uniref:glycosyltransferase n=1 Tax=Citrobacter braakii TaxID=57706 RepID=UPI002540B36B|nr:glycosyltransferase [Citrobacter braakii]WIF77272.1 glycosyltransferase [Citrobacter braakii]
MNKKIILLSPGNNVHTVNVSSSLIRIGFEVHVLSLHDFIDGYDYKVKKVKIPFSAPLGYLLGYRFINAYSKVNNIKMLNAHYATGYGLLGSLSSCKNKVISVWGSDVYLFPEKSILHKFFIKYIFKKYKRVLSTSNDMAKVTRKYTDKEIYITPFAIHNKFLDMSRDLNLVNSHFIIGSTKNFDVKYGVDILIRAYAVLLKKLTIPSKLVLIGDGKEKSNLYSLVNNLNISEHVEFVGKLPHSEIVKFIDRFDIYAILSRSESYGVSALEASARGIPIISSNVGGLPEVVRDSITGDLVDINDIDQIVNTMKELVMDDSRRRKYSINGPKFVLKNYSSKAMDESFKKAMNL